MINLYKQEPPQPSEKPGDIDRINPVKSNPPKPRFIEPKDLDTQKIISDQQVAHEVGQAIKDDQGLSEVAGDIHVTVDDGAITLDGQVSTEQQMNLAAGTAMAVGVVDEVTNHLEVTNDKHDFLPFGHSR
ncbi:MAG: BON domain-containing protein [Candidatus Omnitrophica bacterium]|nr:BON domain-containing protein [Candidatus Omnitrophota bacterium]